jgi:ATP/maltotriose-dependent transcriptional regulator MalT
LVEFYKKEKQYKKAMNAFEKAVAFKDSIFNQAAQKSIISTQVAYETSKKEQKIKNLTTEKEVSLKKAKTKSKQLTYTIAISIILLGGLLVLLYLFRKNSDLEIKNKNEELYSYLLQIDELKSSAKNSTLNHQKNLANNFKEFDLSKREIEVLDCISKGFTNAEMAEKLFVSQNTIKTHIKNIYSKLEVKNRVQAMKKINIIN